MSVVSVWESVRESVGVCVGVCACEVHLLECCDPGGGAIGRQWECCGLAQCSVPLLAVPVDYGGGCLGHRSPRIRTPLGDCAKSGGERDTARGGGRLEPRRSRYIHTVLQSTVRCNSYFVQEVCTYVVMLAGP